MSDMRKDYHPTQPAEPSHGGLRGYREEKTRGVEPFPPGLTSYEIQVACDSVSRSLPDWPSDRVVARGTQAAKERHYQHMGKLVQEYWNDMGCYEFTMLLEALHKDPYRFAEMFRDGYIAWCEEN